MDSKVKSELTNLSKQSLDYAEMLRSMHARVDEQERQLQLQRSTLEEQTKQLRQSVRDGVERLARLGTERATLKRQEEELKQAVARADDLSAKNSRLAERINELEVQIADLERQLRAAQQSQTAAAAGDVSARSKSLMQRFGLDSTRSKRSSIVSVDQLAPSVVAPSAPAGSVAGDDASEASLPSSTAPTPAGSRPMSLLGSLAALRESGAGKDASSVS